MCMPRYEIINPPRHRDSASYHGNPILQETRLLSCHATVTVERRVTQTTVLGFRVGLFIWVVVLVVFFGWKESEIMEYKVNFTHRSNLRQPRPPVPTQNQNHRS